MPSLKAFMVRFRTSGSFGKSIKPEQKLRKVSSITLKCFTIERDNIRIWGILAQMNLKVLMCLNCFVRYNGGKLKQTPELTLLIYLDLFNPRSGISL